MARSHTDLSRVAISVAPSPATSGTSLGVTDANAAYLPDTYPFWAVLVPLNAAPTRANSEIVKVTAGSSSGGTTTYTIARAQGTPVTTAKTVTTSFDIYDANSTEALGTVLSIVENETPGGSINSSNTSFTAAASMVSGSLKVYQNGVRLSGGGVDFTQGSGTAFTMVTAPTTGDILLIDYKVSAGTYSTGSTSFVYDETPSGTINSSNTSFTIASTPVAGSLTLYRDGQRLIGGGADYTLSGTTITFVTAPTTGSTLKVDYQSAVSAAGNADTVDGYHASNNSETDGTLVANYGGWIVINDTLSYSSADSPTFVIGTTKDLTGVIGVGMRIKLTQTTNKYFIVTAITSSTITVYGGTDYTLANAAITLPYFSYQKAPLGFPQSPAKWTVETSDTSASTQASPTASTWYNVNSVTISIPIGAWKVAYYVPLRITKNSTNEVVAQVTLSTANNSESDVDMTAVLDAYFASLTGNMDIVQQTNKEKTIVVAAKTSYYLNFNSLSASAATLGFRATWSKLLIRAICAYL